LGRQTTATSPEICPLLLNLNSFRNTLVQLAYELKADAEPFKASSQNLGHAHCLTPNDGARGKLADDKERLIQQMTATTFWSADGRPMSAAQFVESVFGALPSLFKDKDELRKIWSRQQDTRKALLEGQGCSTLSTEGHCEH
jgi:hypothetical protein